MAKPSDAVPAQPPFRRLLVANRGEIALRIARTCEELGIDPVMIATELDRGAPHANAEFVRTVSSYLDIDSVLEAARSSRADAVHPGYGFLSENADFAQAVIDAGLVWVGPPVAAMRAMARKDAAREIAVAAGVPVVPRGEDAGFPVLVKAAAGGGGKGMRVVHSADELEEARAAAARESLSAFGDDTLLVEKYVERGRHIEVQVMADTLGTVLHLHERDCSAQRRHQKVIEEAPAPTIADEVRELVHSSAVALAREVGYVGAGTVEFLLDEATGEAYFLEMNTRLQVEHPVTELVTGLDLVELQLRVAAGEPLGLAQDDVTVTGHAFEARIYAEDAYAGFLPQAGTVSHVVWPRDARVDEALRDGQAVSTAYDPMLAKVIVHGADREEAREALVGALDGTAVLGLTTNTGFLRQLAASEEFRDAAVDTAWLDRNPLTAPDDARARALAGTMLHAVLKAAPRGPWQPDGFRVGGPPAPLIEHGRVLSAVGWFTTPRSTVGLQRVSGFGPGSGFALRGPHGTEIVLEGQRFVLDEPDPWDLGASTGAGELTAPMPGTVLDVRVAEGDAVTEGQVLGVLEAMKMELSLRAPYDGTVTSVGAVAGRQVALGDALFHVEPEEQS
ncbi:acetyl/propionyl/methylcrotonyl-CoA carboxylase subunit alpha [Nocardioides flavescens]|uniref:ATP-grasp domain-containing protein n=1 Tax=Nocardioides flavescens TaxID=2691959 RepID=A0A6L7EXC9_9ACTN|nr:biotin carboxylase N-terminal domain-containing protein [Nocardioides flavescens]MXG88945.1 ATP-grasp domain-containing protein [Nocardioides flavescens]